MPNYNFPFKDIEWDQNSVVDSIVNELAFPFFLAVDSLGQRWAYLRVEEAEDDKKSFSEFTARKYKMTLLANSSIRSHANNDTALRRRNELDTAVKDEWGALGIKFLNTPLSGEGSTTDCIQISSNVELNKMSLSSVVNMITGGSRAAADYCYLMVDETNVLDDVVIRDFVNGETTQDVQQIHTDTQQSFSIVQSSNSSSDPNIKDDISQSKLYADILMRRKNIVLEGPPGTGKTYAIKGIVKALRENYGRPIGGEGKGEFAITMHPATSYEDFIEGLRPNGEGSFTYQPGVFTEIVRKAIQEPDKDHVVLLDELNRSNVPRVMGDLLTTLEASKRTKQKEIAEEEYLIEGEQSLNYVTFSEEEREGAQSTGFRHAVNAAWKNIVQNEHEQFRYYRNKTGHEHELKVVESADLTRTRKKREFAGDLGFTHSIRLDEVKSGAAFLVINKILHPILDEAWANRLFDESMESPETTMRVWSPGGVVNLEVLENSETGKANLAPYGTIKVRKSQPTCKKDTESKHYFWSEGCDSLWADDRRVEVKLSGSKKRLHVPQNLLVIGTMNTTDRSVAPLDAALRRRFVFLRVDPDESITTSILCKEAGGKISDEGKFRLENSLKIWKKVNTLLRSHLGQDATIGHSYFFDLATELVDVNDSDRAHYLERQAWKYAVLPQVADLLDSTGRANKLLADDSGLKKLNDHIESLGLELNAGEGANRMYARTMVKTLPIETPKTVEEDGTGDSEDGEDNSSVDA